MELKRGVGKQISTYYLTDKQIQKLIDAAPDLRHRLLIRLLKLTAGRRFEIQSLRIEDVDWEREMVWLRRGKGGSINANDPPEKRRERELDIGDPETLKDLREYIGRRTKGYILQSNSKKEGISLSIINRMTSKCGVLAKVENPDLRKKWINPHLFRHSYGRRNDVDLPVKQAILGHRDAYTTMQMYGGLRPADAIKIVREARKVEQIPESDKSLEVKHQQIEEFCRKHGVSVKEYLELIRGHE